MRTTHWHIDPATHEGHQVVGPVGECCEGWAAWLEVFGS